MKLYNFNKETEFKYPGICVDFHWWNQNRTSLHSHDYYEIFILTKGKVQHRINNTQSVLSKKTIFLIKPSDRHMFLPYENSESQHINLKVTSEMLKQICTTLNSLLFERIENNNLPSSKKLNDFEFDFIVSLANQFSFTTNTNLDEIKAIVTQMIFNCLASLMKTPLEQKELPIWFEQLLEKINSPEFLGNKVSDIYKLSNYSQPMLLQYFQKYLGTTIISYFTKIKINYACNLLKNTNFTILYISSFLGFDSISHFNKIFKKHVGTTPGNFRNQNHI
mgnify:CR=1 FL=1|jgi:AraC family cel operon transcriptional repressor